MEKCAARLVEMMLVVYRVPPADEKSSSEELPAGMPGLAVLRCPPTLLLL